MIPAVSVIKGSITTSVERADCTVALYSCEKALLQEISQRDVVECMESLTAIDVGIFKSTNIVALRGVNGDRMVLAPTGSLNEQIDDVRKVRDAAFQAVSKAISAGSRSPVLYLSNIEYSTENIDADFSSWIEVAILGALEASYVTLVAREWYKKQGKDETHNDKLDKLSIIVSEKNAISDEQLSELVKRVVAIEMGKRLSKDMGYGDAERFTPYRAAEHLEKVFKNVPGVSYKLTKDVNVIKEQYPLLYHSARASLQAEHTGPCLVELNYKSPDQSQVKEHVYLVGKGVTFDTGGINVKSGEGMRGMSRDKLGACTVAGFVLAAASMQSTKANITAILSWERNSVGPDSLLPDEVLVSRAGVRVTVVNTDAEGRMVMTDPLAEVKERIVDARKKGDNTPAVVYTVATLTGHVIIAYGGYGATVANGPARNNRLDKHLSEAGMKYGENFENSVLRRDDYSLIASCSEVEDIYQSNTRPSSVTPRGHVYPAAIMIRASGLDKHDSSAKPEDRISYMHLDIAGNAEELGSSGLALPKITGAPIAAFVGAHLV